MRLVITRIHTPLDRARSSPAFTTVNRRIYTLKRIVLTLKAKVGREGICTKPSISSKISSINLCYEETEIFHYLSLKVQEICKYPVCIFRLLHVYVVPYALNQSAFRSRSAHDIRDM